MKREETNVADQPANQSNPAPAPGNSSTPIKKSGLTELFGTVLILIGVLIFLALLSFQSQMVAGQEPDPGNNLIGTFGHYSSQVLYFLFGRSSFLLGPYLLLLGFLTIYRGGFT
ncbi:MAG: DNA translocase FtsK 4TM domain-containing protein, partial [Leptospiraceae bacterium]|nr:DNA translocase FtsK 4TM domain-containing protein [Leptospiraceae bacterium]